MDSEKFDHILKSKVHEFDQKCSRAFNDHKVWKKIKKPGSRNPWFQIVAASAIVILGLSILFEHYIEPVKMVKLTKPVLSGKVFEIPANKTRALEKIDNRPEKEIERALASSINTRDTLIETTEPGIEVAVTDNILQSADSNQIRTEKIKELVKIENSELPLVKSDEVKVIFKRGSAVGAELPPDGKISFRKFKLRIFENRIYDTSAYASGAEVEADRKFRIKF